MADTTLPPRWPTTANLRRLSPTQAAVWSIIRAHPDGVCRRDFALFDIYEVANRISEVEDRLGVVIHRGVCKRHTHKRRFTLYQW